MKGLTVLMQPTLLYEIMEAAYMYPREYLNQRVKLISHGFLLTINDAK